MIGSDNSIARKLSIASARIRNYEVHRPPDLAVASVLCEKDCLAGSCGLDEQWIARPKLVLPIDYEAKTPNIESKTSLCAGDPQLWNDGLHLDNSFKTPNVRRKGLAPGQSP